MAGNLSKNGEITIVAPPIEFIVRCIYENNTVEVNSFSSYVERIMAIPKGANPNKITTGVSEKHGKEVGVFFHGPAYFYPIKRSE